MRRKIRRRLYLKYKFLIEKNISFQRVKNWKKISRYEQYKSKLFSKRLLEKKTKTIKKKTHPFKRYIKLGSKLDFGKNVDNIKKMNEEIKNNMKLNKAAIRINLSKIKEISINGLLYFLSNVDLLDNSRTYEKYNINKDLKYNKKYGINPNNEKLKFLFLKIGFWDYFNIKNPYVISNTTENEYFLKIQTDITANTRYVAELRNFMTSIVPFIKNDVIQEYFEDALTEVMANSVEHAYIEDLPYREKGKWWLCGHYNKTNNCLEFSFRDYGVGLRKTLEYNSSETIKKYIRQIGHHFSDDSKIIQLLVNDEIPKYKNNKNKVRGYGFKKFKELANNIGYNCEMKIFSGKGKYSYIYDINTKNGKEELGSLDFDLGGFLINWKIYVDNGDKLWKI